MASWNRNRALPFAAALALMAMLPVASLHATESKTISAVEIQKSDDGATRIILRGADDPIYTAFMREDPPRLIVELPDVEFSGIATPIEVRNGVVSHVTLGSFGDPRVALSMGRVSVGLEAPSEYELLPDGDELVIEIRRRPTSQAGSQTFASVLEADLPEASLPAAPADPQEAPATYEVDEAVNHAAPVAELATAISEPDPLTEAPEAPAPAVIEASRILEVTLDGDEVSISADGPIDNIDSFTLDEPHRLVVDFWGARSGVPSSRFQGHGATIEQVRVGEHLDKVRVVFDLTAPLASHKLSPSPTGVIIRLVADETANAEERVEETPVTPVLEDVPAAPEVPEAADSAEEVEQELTSDTPPGPPSSEWMPLPDAPEATATSDVPALADAPGATATSDVPALADAPGATAMPAAPALAMTDEVPMPAAEDETASEAEFDAPAGDSWAASATPAAPSVPEFAPTALAEPTAPSAPSGPAVVKSVHFESPPGVDRVVVTLTGEVDSRMVEPDNGTLIVLLPRVTISPEAERRVETREFGGPLEMFSVFQTPDVAEAEVRVVLKRKPGSLASLSWDGGQLRIELPREGSGGASLQAADAMGSTTIEGGASTTPGAGPQSVTAATSPSGQEMNTPGPSAEEAAAATPSRAGGMARDSGGSIPGGSLMDDDLFAGPANPASIDILEEGGFDEDKAYAGRRISLDFKDADMGNILRLIAEVSDLNVIAGQEIDGKVTIRLVDVPWDQALDVILLTKGLGFVRVGNVLRIAQIQTLKEEAERRLQERRAKEKLEDLVVKLQPVNFADVKDVASLVKRLLSARGSVNTDTRTNTLIIKDIPSVVHEATALIKAIDTQTPQVMIEAKIVEATLGFSRGLGATWGVGYIPGSNTGGGDDFHLADGARNTVSTFPNFDKQETNFVAANSLAGVANGLLHLGMLAIEDQLQLDLSLQAAEATNKGKVISSPRVITLDNEEAIIKQGVAIKFESATRDRITISFVDAVLELKVTPHITANRSIIMDIKVSRNAPDVSDATGEIVGINKNETETKALVRDGETIVLGGIYVVDNGHSQTKTPFLADIPLLGVAFRSKSVQDERRELLVFVTPRIVLGAPSSDL